MKNEDLKHKKFSYDSHARTCAPDDFLGQSRRTIKGTPVPQAQIDMIIAQIATNLQLNRNDILLDIACGNGSLSRLLFDSCAGYFGIDISEYLISVANANFARPPSFQFSHVNALEFLQKEREPQKFTKLLCYAAFQYFSDAAANTMLSTLLERFRSLEIVFLGNLPDRDRHSEFYASHKPTEAELTDTETAIGAWRTEDELKSLAWEAGWKAEVIHMPANFYASVYRYDAVLTRRSIP